MKATDCIPLRVCKRVFSRAPTWKSVSASNVSVGVVPDGVISPFAVSQDLPVSASRISPATMLVRAIVPVHLVTIHFSAWEELGDFSLAV